MWRMKLKKVHSALLVSALTCSMIVTPVFAEPESTQSLESQKAAAEGELSDLQSQLNTLIQKANDLELQLISKGQEIAQAEADLAAAQEEEQQQYDAMKLRIKYMYESGDGQAAERVLTSGSISELLTQAEYAEKVHTYDRDQLEEYAATVQEVETLQDTLETEMANLESLEDDYQAQQEELNTTISSKSAEVANLDSMIQEAARKAAEEAAAKAAEEAAAQEAANNNGGGGSGTTDVVQDTPTDNGGWTDNGGGNSTPPSYDASTGNAIVDRAYGKLGCAYVWAACGPDAFDCSGFVSYCLTGSYTRLGTTYTFLGWTQVSDPQPGDVCVNADHCGIYIGGGQMIHAATEGVGVIIGPVQGGMIYVRY